jgi:hypothetical protein
MKIWKNFACLLLAGVSTVLLYSGCTKKSTSFGEKVSDGYILNANEDLLKNVQDDSDYGITFIDVGEQKTVDPSMIKSALSDPSKYFTIEGKATKVGKNKLKIATTSNATIDLKKSLATFWGLNSKKISDFLTNAAGEGDNCGTCYGVKGFTQVTCESPSSLFCCGNCQ